MVRYSIYQYKIDSELQATAELETCKIIVVISVCDGNCITD